MNGVAKAHEMLSTKIAVEDIKNIEYAWNIVLSELTRKNKILAKDDDNSKALTDRILDMQHVLNNPGEIFSESPKYDKNDPKKLLKWVDTKWINVANTWDPIQQYLRSKTPLKKLVIWDEDNITNYTGKQHLNRLAMNYLRRLHKHSPDLKMFMHSDNNLTFKFDGIRSKYKSSKTRNVIISFNEINVYNKSSQQYDFITNYSLSQLIKLCENYKIDISSSDRKDIKKIQEKLFKYKNITLKNDEKHWLQHMINKNKKVSDYLSPKYKQQHKRLTFLRKQRLKERRKWCVGWINFGIMSVPELKEYADGAGIKYDKKLNKKELRTYIFNVAKEVAEKAKKAQEHKKNDDDDESDQNNDDEDKDLNVFENIANFANFDVKDKINQQSTDRTIRQYAKKYHLYTDTFIGGTRKKKLIDFVAKHNMDESQMKKKCVPDYLKVICIHHNEAGHKLYNDDVVVDDDNDKTKSLLLGKPIGPWLEGTGAPANLLTCEGYSSDSPSFTSDSLPDSLKYMKNYPREKLWWDLDFELFQSSFSRLQASCDCTSGAQLPGCCAHIATVLWLIFFAINDLGVMWEDIISDNKRDISINNVINDMKIYKDWKSTQQKSYCFCGSSELDNHADGLIQCDGCKLYFHPICINQTMSQIQDSKVINQWHCPFCNSNRVWTIRHCW